MLKKRLNNKKRAVSPVLNFQDKCPKFLIYGVSQKKVPIAYKIHSFSWNELKIWIEHNLRMWNSNEKSDFGYLNCKCLKIAIKKSKIGKKSIHPISWPFLTSTHIWKFLTKIRIHPIFSMLNPILKLVLTYRHT